MKALSLASRPISVLLVDDHAVVRAGYRQLLEADADFDVCAEAGSGEQACRLAQESQPDVVVMDLSLPGISGIEATRRICQRNPEVRVLVFSMHEGDVFVEQALEAGAHGYIPKSSAPETLLEAVRAIAGGERYIEGRLASRLAVQRLRGGRAKSPIERLSSREFEIFCLLAEGRSAVEIGERLSLSSKTVANYATQIKSRLGVSSAAELTRLAIRYGVLEP